MVFDTLFLKICFFHTKQTFDYPPNDWLFRSRLGDLFLRLRSVQGLGVSNNFWYAFTVTALTILTYTCKLGQFRENHKQLLKSIDVHHWHREKIRASPKPAFKTKFYRGKMKIDELIFLISFLYSTFIIGCYGNTCTDCGVLYAWPY